MFTLPREIIRPVQMKECPGLCAFGPSARISPVRRPAPSLYPQILHGAYHQACGTAGRVGNRSLRTTNTQGINRALSYCCSGYFSLDRCTTRSHGAALQVGRRPPFLCIIITVYIIRARYQYAFPILSCQPEPCVAAGIFLRRNGSI